MTDTLSSEHRSSSSYTVLQVSAGYAHSCCCTTEGELYTWGNNRDGCLGLPRNIKLVDIPQVRNKREDMCIVYERGHVHSLRERVYA